MARYFFSPTVEIGTQVLLTTEESRHVRADRISQGQEIILNDGRGLQVRAVLTGWQNDRALVHVQGTLVTTGCQVFLRCCMALIKSQQRVDWTVEKLSELGADEIVLFPAERSIRRSLTPHRLERMKRIIREAGKQTGRKRIPRLLWREGWNDFIRCIHREENLVFPAFPESRITLWSALREQSINAVAQVTIIIGPEGDFTLREKSCLVHLPRSIPVRLTRNILRSESAMIFGASLLSAFLSDDHEVCPQNVGLQGQPG